ncbi:MAG: DNA polymerase Y family protein, partial [Alphaproteobacteria bacterium]|nr:DNA polymerase Y family protein [Alphaproteobacteria bacterium]
MPRYVCAFLPAFSIESRRKTQPCPPPEPFALVALTSGGWHLDAPSPVARRLGLYAGQLLGDARARVPTLVTAPVNRAREQARLRELSLWCTRFSPYVAPWPEIDAGATGLTFDMTGCAHLFGGEAALLRCMTEALARLGLTARLAMADSIGAAHALCRHGGKAQIIVDSTTQTQALCALPVAALRISAQTAATLRHLGLTRIGDVMDL